MSAEMLRRAAGLIRERAEAASASPWEAWSGASVGGGEYVSSTTERRGTVASTWDGYADLATANAAHIASWHPAVALAVADWLEAEAQAHFHVGDEVRNVYDQPNFTSPALAVARAYLGEPS